MNKSQLRNLYKRKRYNLDDIYRISAQKKIIARMIDFFGKRSQSIISSFIPLKDEIDLLEFNKYVVNSQHKLVTPLVQNNSMTFVDEDGQSHVPQFCIMPSICYDALGYRIGYGLGYYDRYLQNKFDIFKIIANFCQLQCDAPIPIDAWDIKADMIINEVN